MSGKKDDGNSIAFHTRSVYMNSRYIVCWFLFFFGEHPGFYRIGSRIGHQGQNQPKFTFLVQMA